MYHDTTAKRRVTCLICLLFVGLLALPLGAQASEPVRSVDIYVQPFYEAAKTPGAAPKVAVGRSFNDLLASSRREDILKVRDMIAGDPKLTTPMTMMVLAIRLYDVELRDDAVFWFYAAKDRFIALSEVLDVPAAGLTQAEDAVKAFATLAGPVINGYAFCDLAKQKALRAKSLEWLENNPYEAIFMSRLAAKPGDRGANLKLAVQSIRAAAEKERAYFDDPKHVAEFLATRKKNDMDAKFCWP